MNFKFSKVFFRIFFLSLIGFSCADPAARPVLSKEPDQVSSRNAIPKRSNSIGENPTKSRSIPGAEVKPPNNVQPLLQSGSSPASGPSIPTEIAGLQLESTKLCISPEKTFANCVDTVDVRTKFEAESADTFVISFPDKKQCLDLFNSTLTDGGEAIGWKCTHNPEQKWKIINVVASTFQVESVRAPGKCLTLVRGSDSKASGRPLTFTCERKQEQIFQFTKLAPLSSTKLPNYGTDTAPKTVRFDNPPFPEFFAGPLTQSFVSSNVVVYGTATIPSLSGINWIAPIAEKFWTYVKATYGNFNNQRLYVIVHKDESGGLGGTAASSQSRSFNYNNTVALHYCSFCWDVNDFGTRAILSHEIHHVVVAGAFNSIEAPGPKFWGDSTWAFIFQYDLYLNTGYPDDAARMLSEQTSVNRHFRELWYPLYVKAGRTQFLINYFKILQANWPIRSDFFYSEINDMTLGELALFLSAAAKTDARQYVKAAFDWTPSNDLEWDAARIRFPNVNY